VKANVLISFFGTSADKKNLFFLPCNNTVLQDKQNHDQGCLEFYCWLHVRMTLTYLNQLHVYFFFYFDDIYNYII
jgi:hypothetical protein